MCRQQIRSARSGRLATLRLLLRPAKNLRNLRRQRAILIDRPDHEAPGELGVTPFVGDDATQGAHHFWVACTRQAFVGREGSDRFGNATLAGGVDGSLEQRARLEGWNGERPGTDRRASVAARELVA